MLSPVGATPFGPSGRQEAGLVAAGPVSRPSSRPGRRRLDVPGNAASHSDLVSESITSCRSRRRRRCGHHDLLHRGAWCRDVSRDRRRRRPLSHAVLHRVLTAETALRPVGFVDRSSASGAGTVASPASSVTGEPILRLAVGAKTKAARPWVSLRSAICASIHAFGHRQSVGLDGGQRRDRVTCNSALADSAGEPSRAHREGV